MENEKDLIMMYHSALRNVGVFTTLSFGALAHSRVYRGLNDFYNILLKLLCVIFVFCSLTINWYLIKDYDYLVKKTDTTIADKWAFIPRVIFVFNLGILFLGLTTLLRESIYATNFFSKSAKSAK